MQLGPTAATAFNAIPRLRGIAAAGGRSNVRYSLSKVTSSSLCARPSRRLLARPMISFRRGIKPCTRLSLRPHKLAGRYWPMNHPRAVTAVSTVPWPVVRRRCESSDRPGRAVARTGPGRPLSVGLRVGPLTGIGTCPREFRPADGIERATGHLQCSLRACRAGSPRSPLS